MPVVLMVATPLSVFRNGGPRPSMEGAAGRLRRPEGRGHMDKHSLSHTSWECVYHVVWIPKYRRKVLYGEMRREIGQTLRALAERMDGVEIVEGAACPDHIHMCLRIAPKHSVSGVVGKLKGKSAIILHERHPELRRVTGRDRTLWARGYYVSTVGLNESVIRRYIQRQEDGSRIE